MRLLGIVAGMTVSQGIKRMTGIRTGDGSSGEICVAAKSCLGKGVSERMGTTNVRESEVTRQTEFWHA